VDFVSEILARRGLQLTHEGKVLDTPEATLGFLREQAVQFAQHGQPLLQRLGI
jgi:hypothetical protein